MAGRSNAFHTFRPFYPRLIYLCLMLFLAPSGVMAWNRAAAQAAFLEAQSREAELRAKPEAERTLKDYQGVLRLYDKSLRHDPAFAGSDDALLQMAILYREAYEQFKDPKQIDRALAKLNWLLSEYPGSPLRPAALLLKGDIYARDKHDPDLARSIYKDYLARYPRSARKKEVNDKIEHLGQTVPKPPPAEVDLPDRTASAKPASPAETKPAAAPPRPAVPAEPGPAGTQAEMAAQLTEIRYWSTADYTRIVIDLDKHVLYHHNEIENPYRIFVDFQQTVLTQEVKGRNYSVTDLFLNRIRVGQFSENVARVVLDFKKKGSFTIFTLENPFRMVIDIRDADKAVTLEQRKKELARLFQDTRRQEEPRTPDPSPEAAKPAGTAETAKPAEADPKKTPEPVKQADASPKPDKTPPPVTAPPKAEPKPEPAGKSQPAVAGSPQPPSKPTSDGDRTLQRILGMKVARIVIDPGHGGKDSGSIGVNGVKEKEVTLAIAKRLKEQIEARMQVEVLLTRSGDEYVPLEQRTAFAQVKQADLFISIHANYSKDNQIGGIETFFLGLTKDPRSQLIAAIENATAQQNLNQLEDTIKKITIYEKMNESKEFAQKVHRQLFRSMKKLVANARDRGVKRAPFVVLIGTDIPAILVEIGFISNKKEAELIGSRKGQEKVAGAIFKGVEDYLSGLGTMARVQPADE